MLLHRMLVYADLYAKYYKPILKVLFCSHFHTNFEHIQNKYLLNIINTVPKYLDLIVLKALRFRVMVQLTTLNFNQIYVISDCPVAIYSHKGIVTPRRQKK